MAENQNQRPAKIVDVNSVSYLYAKLKSNIDQFQDSTKTAIDQFKSDAQTNIDSAILAANNATSDAQAAANNANSLVKDANGLFLSKVDAQNTYLRQSSAAEIYQTQSGAANTYLSKTDASDIYTTNESYSAKVSDLEKADSDNLAAAKSYAESKASSALSSAKTDAANTYATKNDLSSTNSKVSSNASNISSHSGNTTVHITADERAKWNAAKTHADSTHARTDATNVAKSSTNGNIKINGTETTVYTHPGGTNPHGTTKNDVGLGNVGNFKAVSTVASQGLSDAEKSNARANIGAQVAGSYAAANHSHNYAGSSSAGGVANSAVKLATARNIAISGAVTGNANFDGSGNITISTSVNHSHNYAGSSSAGGAANSANMITGFHHQTNNQTWGVQIGSFIAGMDDDCSGSLAFRKNCPSNAKLSEIIDGYFYQNEGNYRCLDTSDSSSFAAANHSHNYAGSSSAGGAANSAVKLATARKIALGNALSGSANFDGSGNITISAKVNKGTTAPSSLAEGSVFFVYE